ncbi:dTDP-4-dehydrorhamnose 3,5-epimerase [Pseudoalteromonas rubra]|uniref:dTDP-4-dehydrorhamnose 3,5-epimerase n=1 Tax=Pseudoalteromonas rubra TaxID=43658 RepID=A0A0F4QF04_9GAMM|nr:dTDP-4-dehydrorhamnose 3,5-epimerase [Pseudoalteromonas rubra]KJZ05824.1 dTDP-4-dehydrorhamnose 3,5-epimerase [Pseudoalteromonas rubra]
MIFHKTPISGLYLVEEKRIEDDRGFFARTFCEAEFAEHGLNTEWAQNNRSYNVHKGTLRGLHMQSDQHAEVKLVSCTRGKIWDVAVDLRPDSPTFKQWYGVYLEENDGKYFHIPKGFLHGYITLEEHSEVHYKVSDPYQPNSEVGVLWSDKELAIEWPITPQFISSKDEEAVLLEELL